MKFQKETAFYDQVLESFQNFDFGFISNLSQLIKAAKQNNGKVYIFGNGANVSIASHFALDLIKCHSVDVSTFSDSSLITALSNDLSFDKGVEHIIDHFASIKDIVILLSSSGESQNIINGAYAAKRKNCHLVTLTGFSKMNRLNSLGNMNYWVDSNIYNVVELNHLFVLLNVVEYMRNLK